MSIVIVNSHSQYFTLFENERNLQVLGFEGGDAGGVHIVLGDEHVEEAERHLEFGGEFEIGAVEIEADADLRLHVVGVEFEHHFAEFRRFLLLGGNHVEGVLAAGDHVGADVVQHPRRLVLEQNGQIQIDGLQVFRRNQLVTRCITDSIVDIAVTEGDKDNSIGLF